MNWNTIDIKLSNGIFFFVSGISSSAVLTQTITRRKYTTALYENIFKRLWGTHAWYIYQLLISTLHLWTHRVYRLKVAHTIYYCFIGRVQKRGSSTGMISSRDQRPLSALQAMHRAAILSIRSLTSLQFRLNFQTLFLRQYNAIKSKA